MGKRKGPSKGWKGDPALERFDLLISMREEGNNAPEILHEIKHLIPYLLQAHLVSAVRIRNRLKKMDRITQQQQHQG